MTSLTELLNWFGDKDKVLVSLSGGVDSALVAYAANKKLGKNAIAVTADYKTLSSEELDSAKSIAHEIGITLLWIAPILTVQTGSVYLISAVKHVTNSH